MIFKEIIYYIKDNKLFSIVLYVEITILLVLIASLTIFISRMKYEINNMKQIFDDKAILQISDNYYEPSDFTNFLEQYNSLNLLKSFYKDMNSQNMFDFITHFNQPIYVDNIKLPAFMGYGYDSGYPTDKIVINGTKHMLVKSMQMNYNSYDFFNIDVSEGMNFNKNDFNDKDGIISVILGDSYKGIYKIGDEFNINYYFMKKKAIVIGFLKPSSKIYYAGDSEFLLDEYIILPYINYNKPMNKDDDIFQKRVYFAMINGYVVTENIEKDIKKTINIVDIIAKRNAIDYSFLGINPHLQSYNHIIIFIEENINLVLVLFFTTIMIGLIMISNLLHLQQKRRLSHFAIHILNGATKTQIFYKQFSEIYVIMFFSFLTYYLFIHKYLIIGNILIDLIILLLITFLSFILTFLLVRNLYNISIANLINSKE